MRTKSCYIINHKVLVKLMSRNAAETTNMFSRSLQEFVQHTTADAVSPPTQRGTVTPERLGLGSF